MRMTDGDFFDRYTILQQKAKFDEQANTELNMFNFELRNVLEDPKFKKVVASAEFLQQLVLLSVANSKIWENEAAIRDTNKSDPANDRKLTLEEIGRRTLIIREHNKQRVEAKNKINSLFGSDRQDNKVNHQSA